MFGADWVNWALRRRFEDFRTYKQVGLLDSLYALRFRVRGLG